jgi:hypothetical protein
MRRRFPSLFFVQTVKSFVDEPRYILSPPHLPSNLPANRKKPCPKSSRCRAQAKSVSALVQTSTTASYASSSSNHVPWIIRPVSPSSPSPLRTL